uniref:Molybdopterin biosynthesis protein n=1 Tax=Acrosorium ciliolatum TaxID=1550622 RepID=A0A1Z1M2F5_9FLOR|nr:Molybdopterin biosynthesis protein [Acrosorium ciliolatum]ARW60080.1 Molybdopterin biosynthesis protein [Acrosorium ciliolatum]
MLNPYIPLIGLSDKEYNIYAKHLILENIGLNGQKRLKKAKILVIGAGGLGCPALMYLVVSGIGYIGIIDNDYIDLSNLNRQILYSLDDINHMKTTSAKNKIKNINKQCKIITHNYKLCQKNASEIIQYYDIIIDANDNFKTRYIIDKICYKLHKIHIYGAIQEFEGQITVFNYQNSNRYSKIYPERLNLIDNNCNNYGVIGIITGNIGIIQATEAIKIILGIGQIINNKILRCNLLNISFYQTQIYNLKKSNKYKNKLLYNNYLKKIISLSKFHSLNKSNKQFLLIIDLRQKNEFKEKHISKSINIPINKLKINKSLQFLQKNNKYKTIVIYCNKIYRSVIASYILHSHNIDHYILNNIK